MDYAEFQTFFKNHIKQYVPYKDSPIFQMFTEFLSSTYFSDSYEAIPATFKEAFENQIIPSEFIDPFLQSLGIPTSILASLSVSDKFKLVTSISDFHRYKGTVKVIDNLISTFNTDDSLAVYELYIDFSVDLNGQRVWEALPSLIKSSAKSEVLTTPEPFSILNDANNWLIDAETLNNLYDNGDLELPYKSPAILLDSTTITDLSVIIQLVSSLVLATIANEKIQLFFNNGIYLTTFESANALWFYIEHSVLQSKLYQNPSAGGLALNPGEIFSKFEIPNNQGNYPRGGAANLNAPIIAIQTLLDEYSRIETRSEIEQFKNNYINIFRGRSLVGDLTFAEYRARVSAIVGVELVDYVDQRISSSLNPTTEASAIRSELYNSFLTFRLIGTPTIDMLYFDYYLLNLPGIVRDIKSSSTYILLNFLKPYHSDLLTRVNSKTIINNKFDNGLVGYANVFQTLFESSTIADISDKDVSSTVAISRESETIINEFIFDTVYFALDRGTAENRMVGTLNYIADTVQTLKELSQFVVITPAIIDNVAVIVQAKYNPSTIHSTYPEILDSFVPLIFSSFADSLHISDANSRSLVANVTESLAILQNAAMVSLNHADHSTRDIAIETAVTNVTDTLADSLHISDANSRSLVANVTESLAIFQKAAMVSLNHADHSTRDIAIETAVTNVTDTLADSLHISDANAIKSSSMVYDNVIAVDAVPAYIYDNPNTGVHIVYTS